MVFINNHNLSMSPKLWDEPETYQPSRFLDPRTGQFTKPEYFQVFDKLTPRELSSVNFYLFIYLFGANQKEHSKQMVRETGSVNLLLVKIVDLTNPVFKCFKVSNLQMFFMVSQ